MVYVTQPKSVPALLVTSTASVYLGKGVQPNHSPLPIDPVTMITTLGRVESRFHSPEVAGNKGPQKVVPVCIERRSRSFSIFLRSILGHLEEVVGIVFDDYDVYRRTPIRKYSRVNWKAYRIQRRLHKLLASFVCLQSVSTLVSLSRIQVRGQLTLPVGFWPTGTV